MKRVIIIAFLVILCMACSRKSDNNILLRLQYHKGQKIDRKYLIHTISDSKIDEPLKDEYLRMELTVDSVTKDSSYILSTSIEHIKTINKELLHNEIFSFDTNDPMVTQESYQREELKSIIDSIYSITINNRGQIIKPSSFSSQKLAILFDPVYYYEVCQIVFPEKSISIGDKWTDDSIVPLTNSKRKTIFSIESINNATIQIKVSGSLEIKHQYITKFTGRYVIDKKTKNIISGKVELFTTISKAEYMKEVITIRSN